MKNTIVRLFSAFPDFFRRAAISFTMRFAGLFIQFVGSILVARALGPEGFGAFTYAFIVASIFGLALSLGMSELSVREIPHFLAKGDTGSVTGFVLVALGTILVTGSLVAILLAVLQRTGVLVFEPGWNLVALMALAQGLIIFVSNVLNGFQRILTSQFLETIVRQGLYLAMISAALMIGIGLSPRLLFVFALLAVVPPFALMMMVLVRTFRRISEAPVRPKLHMWRWQVAALPLFVTTFANILQTDLDVLMVGAMLTDFDVGVYRAAARGAALVSIANMIGIQLVGPMLSRAIAEKNTELAQQLLSQAALVTLVLGSAIILVLAVWSEPYLHLFGKEFPVAAPSLRLLLIAQASLVLAGADVILLVILHRERFVLFVTLFGVFLNLGLNYVLIGKYGIEGAAAASAIAMVTVRATLVYRILTTTQFNTTVFGHVAGLLRRRRA